MAIRKSLARRYSKALMASARSDTDLDIIVRDLKSLADAYASSEELRTLLSSPLAAADAKKKVLGELTDRLASCDIVTRLAGLLLEGRRTEYIPVISEAFSDDLDKRRGVIRGEVAAPELVDTMGLARVQVALSKALGKKVILTQKADPGLIGGLQVRVGGILIDGSLKGRLESIKEGLKQT
jgi:F-type H+-transporting ATPase subunit delta